VKEPGILDPSLERKSALFPFFCSSVVFPFMEFVQGWMPPELYSGFPLAVRRQMRCPAQPPPYDFSLRPPPPLLKRLKGNVPLRELAFFWLQSPRGAWESSPRFWKTRQVLGCGNNRCRNHPLKGARMDEYVRASLWVQRRRACTRGGESGL